MDNLMLNNKIYLEGKVVSGMEFSHEMYGEGFYTFLLEVTRLSDSVDLLNITVSERLISNMDLSIGKEIVVLGQLRSYNKFVDGANKLILTVFARNIEPCIEKSKNPNEIFLDGYICKEPVYRKTPFGREIADVLLAVNRAYNKSDYIPTIAWGRNARFCQNLEVGTKVKIVGRVQSRMYEKKHEDGCAADCYIEGFRLIEKLSSDLIRNSSYPLLLLSLLHNSKRMEILSDDEMEKILSKVLGSDWKDYLYEYKRNLGKHYEPGQ